MARIFRQTTTKTIDGCKVRTKSRKWYVEYRDGQGIRRRKAGFANKAATRQLAAELERQAEHEASGLRDRCAEHRKRPLTRHVDDWRETLIAKGTTEKHADLRSEH